VEGGVAATPSPRSRTGVHVGGPVPRVVEGGPRRWGMPRFIALARSVMTVTTTTTAAAAATITSTILAIAVVVATLSLALYAIARGIRRSRGRWGRGVVGVEWLRWRRGCVGAEREFLQDQVFPYPVEGHKRHAACDDGSKMIIPLVQTP
jgi:hypothetical protein